MTGWSRSALVLAMASGGLACSSAGTEQAADPVLGAGGMAPIAGGAPLGGIGGGSAGAAGSFAGSSGGGAGDNVISGNGGAAAGAGAGGMGGAEAPPPDADDDAVPDASDNCPMAANADHEDIDADTIGDACDRRVDRLRVPRRRAFVLGRASRAPILPCRV